MWTKILLFLPKLLISLPSIIMGIEKLFEVKPKSGEEKFALVQSLALDGINLAAGIDPVAVPASATSAFVKDIINAIVKYFNAVGVFKTTSGIPGLKQTRT